MSVHGRGAVLSEFSMFARIIRSRRHGARQVVLCKKLITQDFNAGDTSCLYTYDIEVCIFLSDTLAGY